MKIGLYSITYLGCWYRGEALTLPEIIRTATPEPSGSGISLGTSEILKTRSMMEPSGQRNS